MRNIAYNEEGFYLNLNRCIGTFEGEELYFLVCALYSGYRFQNRPFGEVNDGFQLEQ